MSDVLVLCYHGVSPSWPATISIDPARLERQLGWYVRRGYRGATFRDALLAPPAPRTLAVTFDDAYASVLELARPVLDSLGLPGSVYAPTELVGSGRPMQWDGIEEWIGTPYEQELVPLGWEQLGELREAGWEVGSHSRRHAHLTRLPAAELAEELLESRREVERRLGGVCDTLAYPYGHVDARVADAAGRAGYRAGGAVSSRRPAAILDWPRVGVWHEDGVARLAVKASGPVRRLRRDEADRADEHALPPGT